MSQTRLTGLNPKTKTKGYIVRKKKVKLTRKSVLKMLAVMAASQNTGPPMQTDESTPPATNSNEEPRPQDFLQSGRTGRRNALANILGEHAIVTSSDLPSQLEALTTKDKTDNSQNSEASTSKS